MLKLLKGGPSNGNQDPKSLSLSTAATTEKSTAVRAAPTNATNKQTPAHSPAHPFDEPTPAEPAVPLSNSQQQQRSPFVEDDFDEEEEDESDDDSSDEESDEYEAEPDLGTDLQKDLKSKEERARALWKMDVAALVGLLQRCAVARAVGEPMPDEQVGLLLKNELRHQLRLPKRLSQTLQPEHIDLSSVLPLFNQLTPIPYDPLDQHARSCESSRSLKGKEKVYSEAQRREEEEEENENKEEEDTNSSRGKTKRDSSRHGMHDEETTFERLIPGTILDTRRYTGKFSQRVRHNDIDHILVKRKVPGKEVLLTKGRITIVEEDVNTFSDHYGKRIQLTINLAKLRNKQLRKQSGKSESNDSSVHENSLHASGNSLNASSDSVKEKNSVRT